MTDLCMEGLMYGHELISPSLQGTTQIHPDGTRFVMDIHPDEIVLTCLKAEKSDTGKYACTIKNPKGSDTATVNVHVLGKAWYTV